jgi:hypothetical protein
MTLFRVIPSGDLQISDEGDLVLVGGVDYVRQKMLARFKFFLGEWFLDQREGIPYFKHVFTKNPDLRVIRSVFRQVALSVHGVSSLLKFDVVYTPSTRSLAINLQAVLDTGELLDVPPTAPFIITVQP